MFRHTTSSFLNTYNVIALIAIIMVCISLKYALPVSRETRPLSAGSVQDTSQLNFYHTIENTAVPTSITRRVNDKKKWLRGGVFSSRENAIRQIERIRQLNIPANIEIDAKGRHAIWMGPFTSRQLLQSTREHLMRANIEVQSTWRK